MIVVGLKNVELLLRFQFLSIVELLIWMGIAFFHCSLLTNS